MRISHITHRAISPLGMFVKELGRESWPSCKKPYRQPSAKAKTDKEKKHLLSKTGKFESLHLCALVRHDPPKPQVGHL